MQEQSNGQIPHKPNRTPISNLGEFGLIERLTKHIQLQNKSSIKGIGDDAAVIDNRNKLTVVSTDLLIEGIHFDLMYVPLKHLGYKSVVVNLSDIYAMNAVPKQITVSLAVSNRFIVEAIDEFYDGIYAACRNYNVDLVGGDTSSSQRGMFISVTAIGEADPDDIVCRNTAQVGDYICVSGDLGAAYLGLQLLEREKRIFLENPTVQPDLQDQAYLIGRQLKPEARNDIGPTLKKYGIKPTSMIDISDGLSSELLHICRQSGVGCHIFEENIPVHSDTLEIAAQFQLNPITPIMNGGEDYELLFTVSPQHLDILENELSSHIALIGQIVSPDKGCKIITRGGNELQLVAQGWKHL